MLPLQWQLHPGDHGEGDQIGHQRFLLLQAAEGTAAARQLKVVPTHRHGSIQLLQRLRLRYLERSKVIGPHPSASTLTREGNCASHLVDLAGELRARGHVTESQRLVGWVVEETLVKSRREEGDGGAAVNQSERQQAADIKVQVITQSCARTRRAET